MIPVAEILVFCLYVLLIQEIIEIFFFGQRVKDNRKSIYSGKIGPGSTNYQRGRAHPIEKPKNINSLDGLWRRMRQATENYRLFHKKDAMITEVMSAARAEAYDAMVKKNSQEKQRLLKTNKEAEKD